MRIEKRQISELNPSAYNPRQELKEGDAQFESLKASIEAFGNVEPVVWNERTGNIVGGHQRFNALRSLGETEIYVSVVNMSLEEEKLLNVALNKIKGSWDYAMLGEILGEFEFDDLEVTGFLANEIALLTADEEDIPPFDEVPLQDDESDEVEETDTTNYVIEIVFPGTSEALAYMRAHGWEKHYVKNKNTAVIPIAE